MLELATLNKKSEVLLSSRYLINLQRQHDIDIDKFRLQINYHISADCIMIAPKGYLDNHKSPKINREVIFYLNDIDELYEDILEKLINLAKINNCAVYAQNYRGTGLSTPLNKDEYINEDNLFNDIIYTMDHHVKALKEGYLYANYKLCGRGLGNKIAIDIIAYYAVTKSIDIELIEYKVINSNKANNSNYWLPKFDFIKSAFKDNNNLDEAKTTETKTIDPEIKPDNTCIIM